MKPSGNYLMQAIKYQSKIEASRKLVTKVSKLFQNNDVQTDQYRDAIDSLKIVRRSIQELTHLLDSADLAETDVNLRFSLMKPLSRSEDLTYKLITMLSEFIVKSRPPSKEVMIQLQEIGNTLRVLEKSLDELRSRMSFLQKQADSPNIAKGEPKRAKTSSHEKLRDSETSSILESIEVGELEQVKPLPSEAADAHVSRYADLTFYDDYSAREAGNKISDRYVLQCEHWYRLEVAVRNEPTGMPFKGQERYPIREPKQQSNITIMVTTEGDGFEIEEPVQTLILPPLGDSKDNAQFRVRPVRQSTNKDDLAAIRVRLYFEFNLLEVAVICAEVVGKFEHSTESLLGLEKPISFKQERLEHEYLDFDNIQPREMHIDISRQGEYYQFNFTFRNDTGKKLVFTASSQLTASDLEDALMKVRKLWYDISLCETFTRQLEGDKEEFSIHIAKLANAGRELWRRLFKREQRSAICKIGGWLEKHPLKPGGIIQVSCQKNASNFVFPWALLYDRSLSKRKGEYPTPEGFWGVRYCIEQRLPNMIGFTDKAIQIEDKLKLGFMLWKEFRNVEKEYLLMDTLEQQCAGKLIISNPPIDVAEDAIELLRDCDAHILYFYTHGYTRHRDADIGVGKNLDLFMRWYKRLDKDSPLHNTFQKLYESVKQGQFETDRSWIELTYGKIYLDELYDDEVDLQAGSLVFLNMCESAQVTPSLSDSFIQFFLDRGAKSVIGTECPMTIEFAHPFAERLLRGMLLGERVGINLLNTRRYFMQLNNPLGLAYTLFGSATVCFEPPSLSTVSTNVSLD